MFMWMFSVHRLKSRDSYGSSALSFIIKPLVMKGFLEINCFVWRCITSVKWLECKTCLTWTSMQLFRKASGQVWVPTLDFCAQVESISLFSPPFHLLSSSFMFSISTSSFRQSVDKQAVGGEEGWREVIRGQSRHHSRLHPFHRCVSANDLMNTSRAD